MTFQSLNILPFILRAISEEGYTTPTPIQEQAIPLALQGKDILGCAQTGTGKTAAFSIPIIQRMSERSPQPHIRFIGALILTPTRELALQIGESIACYGRHAGLRHTVVFGGVNQFSQVNALRAGVDILVATPGRLLDLMQQGYVRLDKIQYFVLDEADRMLDMGFVHDVRRIIAKLPTHRQSLFFSATMPPEIISLAGAILHNPARIEVTPVSSTAATIKQFVYFVDRENKRHLLRELLHDKSIERVLVFTRTKHGADKVARFLQSVGISAAAIHGNKSQNARQTALYDFKTKKCRVLVATDIAARGIDIDDLTHVINFELPNVPESYVHRIGRTGRAGAGGVAIALCDAEEKTYLRDIQRLTGITVDVADDHNYPLVNHHPVPAAKGQANGRFSSGQSSRGFNSSRRHKSGRNRFSTKQKPTGVAVTR